MTTYRKNKSSHILRDAALALLIVLVSIILVVSY
jgi:hypothetical protein